MAVSNNALLGARARGIRHARGVTQERLAESLGVSAAICNERGEGNLPLDSVDLLAQLLCGASLILRPPVASDLPVSE